MSFRKVLPALVAVLALGAAACSSDTAEAGPTKAATTAAKAHTHQHDMAGMSASEMAAMSGGGAAAVDDRGFSKLENGMQHGHAFQQAISKADRVELARQLTLAREVALQYPTVADAEKAGLHRAGPFSPGLGAHYISYGNSGANPDGAMSDDDIRKPLAWIYDGTHPDSRVSGLFYMTGTANAAGFAGPNDTWHVHHDICLTTGPNGIDAPLGADHDATKAQCDAVHGNLLKQTGYLLHVWVVPGYESPEGVFSHLSSTITCDDGSYNLIADVTAVGTKTSVCADGTE
jgi:hypothetical protein